MREQKYRVWDKTYKQMYYPRMDNGEPYRDVPSWDSDFHAVMFHVNSPCDNVDGEVEFLEYTGLKDNDGKEIYEGDVLSVDEYTGVVVVKFGAHATSTDYYCDSAYGFYGESIKGDHATHQLGYINKGNVIGNIYESPELLCKKDK